MSDVPDVRVGDVWEDGYPGSPKRTVTPHPGGATAVSDYAPMQCRKRSDVVAEAMQWDGTAEGAEAIIDWALGTRDSSWAYRTAGLSSSNTWLRIKHYWLHPTDVLVRDPDAGLLAYRDDVFAASFQIEAPS